MTLEIYSSQFYAKKCVQACLKQQKYKQLNIHQHYNG